jgi:hypothetical protein
MALKVSVSTGKQEAPRSSAGLIKRAANEETADKHVSVTITEIVSAIFQEVRSSLEKEADVEVEFTANVDIQNKDGVPTISLDISGENPNARTMRLKFNTKLNPQDEKKK